MILPNTGKAEIAILKAHQLLAAPANAASLGAVFQHHPISLQFQDHIRVGLQPQCFPDGGRDHQTPHFIHLLDDSHPAPSFPSFACPCRKTLSMAGLIRWKKPLYKKTFPLLHFDENRRQ